MQTTEQIRNLMYWSESNFEIYFDDEGKQKPDTFYLKFEKNIYLIRRRKAEINSREKVLSEIHDLIKIKSCLIFCSELNSNKYINK